MKICFVSDLHVDFSQPPIAWQNADVLVIGGDTANTIGGELKLLRKVSKLYKHVVTVDGNHTHYSNFSRGRTVEETLESIRKQIPENVHLLGHHQPKIMLDGVWFAGCNGWYSFDMIGDPIENRVRWKQVMNDNQWIGFDKILQDQPWDRAENDANLMRQALEDIANNDPDNLAPIVCVTHTAPHRDMVTWSDNDFNWNRNNSFYVNSHMQRVLESEVGQRVSFWYNGHTHHKVEKVIGGVFCFTNPRGYPTENPSWKPIVLPVIM